MKIQLCSLVLIAVFQLRLANENKQMKQLHGFVAKWLKFTQIQKVFSTNVINKSYLRDRKLQKLGEGNFIVIIKIIVILVLAVFRITKLNYIVS